jgi:nicotinamide riboside kinase
MQEVKKIVVIGPESTGKSTLCQQLAAHYSTTWCPEYAREYLLKNGMNYTYEDLLTIAKGQLALESKYFNEVENRGTQIQKSNCKAEIANEDIQQEITNYKLQTSNLLFVDTDMYVMKVWCEYVFNKCHLFILEKIVEQACHLYLLCNVDLPWIKDELREYPDLESRQELHHIYKDILINQHVPWIEVSGNYDLRLNTAVKAVDALLTSS